MTVFALQYGAKAALMKLFDTSYAYAANTFVGPLSLEKKVKEQAQSELQQQIATWKTAPHMQFQYGETTFFVPTDLFAFDVTDTMKNIKSGQHSLITVSIQTNKLDTLLSDQLNPEIADQIDRSKLEKDLVKAASSLESKASLQIVRYINVQTAKKTISQANTASIASYQSNLQQWMSQLGTVTIPAKSELSVTNVAVQKNLNIDDGSLSVISSLMYEAVAPTNFQVRKRNTSMVLPAYAKLGLEAYIEQGKSDFVFYNPNDTDYTFQFSLDGTSMGVSLQGLPFVYTYVTNKNEVETIDAREIQQYVIQNETKNDAVTAESKGKNGFAVTVYREQYKNGNLITRDKIGQDFYLQVNGVKNIQVAPPATQTTVQTPTNGQTTQQATTTNTNPSTTQSTNQSNTTNGK